MPRRRSQRKNVVLPIEKFPFLVLSRDEMMLQNLIIHYLSSGLLREVKNKGKCQTFSSTEKSGRGRLREVVAYKRFQI